ncbi:endonuclease/exonuclease/phosphatase family protein [Actinomadura geliboluensis]|uniref:endonuclease/exonuclease/phosphatase family protein n=1 Tax=Actinomadura geliboluensis TaxID=882440 RepID=UPI003724C26B
MTAPATRADDEPLVIGVGYQNLREGGTDGDDDARLQQMVDRLADADLDVVLLGEARWRDRGDRQLHQVAERLGASFRCRVRSNHYGCDMAVFIREDALRVAEERHEQASVPWFHVADAGFRDAGAVYGDLSPTVGIEDGKPAYRCDRIYCNVPGATVSDFAVLPPFSSGDQRRLSDHAAVIARVQLCRP